jgi:hypothetical protein
MAELFQEMPITQAFSHHYHYWASKACPSLISTIHSHGQMMGRKQGPGLVLVGPVPDKSQSEMAGIFQMIIDHGIRLKIVSEETEWSYKDHRLWADDFPADILTFTLPSNAAAFVLEKGLDHPVLRAAADGSAVILNGLFRSLFFYSKLLFAALSDPAFAHLLGPELSSELQQYIPWSRIVREGKTLYRGRTIDLVPYIAEAREHFVLKPAHGFGGLGVLLGWTCSSDEWNQALKNALETPFLVQERIQQKLEPYPLIRDGQLEFEMRYADLNPYIWNDRYVSGYFVRVSRELCST